MGDQINSLYDDGEMVFDTIETMAYPYSTRVLAFCRFAGLAKEQFHREGLDETQ